MQSSYAEQFQRDMGCTEAEWLGWLPAAMGDSAWQQSQATAEATIGAGKLSLRWQVMPPPSDCAHAHAGAAGELCVSRPGHRCALHLHEAF